MDLAEEISQSNQRSLGNDLLPNLFSGDKSALSVINKEVSIWMILRKVSEKMGDAIQDTQPTEERISFL